MAAINYTDKIPNNVNLANDRTLQRALEHWQPHFLQWWQGMGPTDFQGADVYLRTAVSVDAQGWAQYGAVWPRRCCCSTEAGSVSPWVTMSRRSVERNSPGTCCQAGWPMLSPKPILRSATGSARKMPQR